MPFLIRFNGGEQFHGFSGVSLELLVLGGALGGAWLALGVIRWFATRPRLPKPGPATMDMGPEPPAIVNFLVNRCHVTSAAMAATLVDLAAQRKVGIDMLDLEHGVVRLRPGAEEAEGLRPYERQVLDFVKSRATGGSAPLEVLELDDAGTADRWRKRFRESVVKEARSLGLARDRWSKFDYTWLIIGLLVVIEVLALALASAHLFEQNTGSGDDFGRWDWLWIGPILWFVLVLGLSRLRSLRETAKGREVAARWLGVQQYLRENPALQDVPPAAVTVWEHVLSAGVALGAAHATTMALPFDADDPETAWTRQTGVWRQVRIEYPKRFGFGEAPWKATVVGLFRAVVFGALSFVALPKLVPVLFDLRDEFGRDQNIPVNFQLFILGAFGVMTLLGLYWAILAVSAAIRFIRGALDLGKEKVVEGEVVQLHLGRVAVDEGREDEITAWTPPPGAPGIQRGMRVRARVSPRLHHVTKVEVLSAEGVVEGLVSPEDAGRQAIGAGAIPSWLGGGRTPELDLAAIAAATGIQLHQSSQPGAAQGPVAMFEAAGGGHVMVVRFAGPPGVGRMMSFAMALGSRGDAVQDLPGAHWSRGSSLTMDHNGEMLVVTVEMPELPEASRQQLAVSIVRQIAATA